MNNTRKFSTFFQVLRLIPIPFCRKSVAARGTEHVAGVRAVPGHAAVQAHLLQRNPLPIVGQNHGKACRAAFQSLHLHHNRDFGNVLRDHRRGVHAVRKPRHIGVQPVYPVTLGEACKMDNIRVDLVIDPYGSIRDLSHGILDPVDRNNGIFFYFVMILLAHQNGQAAICANTARLHSGIKMSKHTPHTNAGQQHDDRREHHPHAGAGDSDIVVHLFRRCYLFSTLFAKNRAAHVLYLPKILQCGSVVSNTPPSVQPLIIL